MGKDTRYYKGKYYQGSLSDDRAEAILNLVSQYEVVTSLRHVIKDLPEHLIYDLEREALEYEELHGSLEGFVNRYKDQAGVGTLRDAQTIGVAFMYYAGSALLGDEVGLGKTVQIAGLVNLLEKEFTNKGKEFRFLFLTEKTSAGQIRKKLMQFTGEYIGLMESGEKKEVEQYLSKNVEKRHYSIVGPHSLLLNPEFLTDSAKRPFDLIVVDESSVAKNQSSSFYINAKALFKHHKRKILLNATPVEVDIREMYNQLDLLDPNLMPTVGDFNKSFRVMKRATYGFTPAGYKNEEYFREAIKLCYLARTRKDLGANYEDNLYRTILVPLSKEQKSLMTKTSLKQMVFDYPAGVLREVEFTPQTTPKLAVLLDLVNETVKVKGEQILVYIKYVEAQKSIASILEEQGYRVTILNGRRENASAKKRTEKVGLFNDGHYDVMLTNVLRGIDLNACDTAVLYSIDPNPQKMVQFEGRITREFNIEGKSVILLVAMGREKNFVEKELKLRIDASAAFASSGKSMVLEAINSGENREVFTSVPVEIVEEEL